MYPVTTWGYRDVRYQPPTSRTIVAFNLGTCDGKLMYQAIEWYFPQYGQALDPKQYENFCTGNYVGG